MRLSLLSSVRLGGECCETGAPSAPFAKFGAFTADGSCFAVVSSDNGLLFYRVDETVGPPDSGHAPAPEAAPYLSLRSKSDVRDFCWFPNFSGTDPDSCCFLIAARNTPVRVPKAQVNLYDSVAGSRHFTFKPINAVGEIAESYSVDFHPLGKYFLTGSLSAVYVFDVQAPGEHLEVGFCRLQLRRLATRRSLGQKGIISCIAHCPVGSGNAYACGSYASSVCVYDHNESRAVSLVGDFLDPECPLGPVTQVCRAHAQLRWVDERRLLVGCRNDLYLRLYDVRGDLSAPVVRFRRPAGGNQKLAFDFRDGLVASGTSDGSVLFYDLLGAEVHSARLSALPVPVFGFSPGRQLALVCSGTRDFSDHLLDSPADRPGAAQAASGPFSGLYRVHGDS